MKKKFFLSVFFFFLILVSCSHEDSYYDTQYKAIGYYATYYGENMDEYMCANDGYEEYKGFALPHLYKDIILWETIYPSSNNSKILVICFRVLEGYYYDEKEGIVKPLPAGVTYAKINEETGFWQTK